MIVGFAIDILANNLSKLSDVKGRLTPSDGQVLTWDNTNGYWNAATSGGASRPTVTSVSTNTHTVPGPANSSELEHIYKYTASGTVAVTLPTASGIEGFKLNLKRFGSGVVTISPAGSEKINNSTTAITLDSDRDSGPLVSDDSNWMSI